MGERLMGARRLVLTGLSATVLGLGGAGVGVGLAGCGGEDADGDLKGGDGGGGGGGGGDVGAPSGVTADKQMSELSEAEYRAICEATAVVHGTATAEEARKASCNLGGAIAAGMAPADGEAACRSAVEQCLGAPDEGQPAPGDGGGGGGDGGGGGGDGGGGDGGGGDGGGAPADPCADAAAQLGNCQATVGEYEACKNAQAQVRNDAFKASAALSCGELVAAQDNPAEAATLPECEATKGKGCGQG